MQKVIQISLFQQVSERHVKIGSVVKNLFSNNEEVCILCSISRVSVWDSKLAHSPFPLCLCFFSFCCTHKCSEITTFRIQMHTGLVWFVEIQALSQVLGFSLVFIFILSGQLKTTTRISVVSVLMLESDNQVYERFGLQITVLKFLYN